MFWFNVTRGTMEHVASPVCDAQAIQMLTGHPNSSEFIEEYRGQRQTLGIVEALQRTGDTFRMIRRGAEPHAEARRQPRGSRSRHDARQGLSRIRFFGNSVNKALPR